MSEEKGIKRAWNSIKYWWVFESGNEKCKSAVATASAVFLVVVAAYAAGYSNGCGDFSKISDHIVNKSVATTIETMKLMNNVSKEDSK